MKQGAFRTFIPDLSATNPLIVKAFAKKRDVAGWLPQNPTSILRLSFRRYLYEMWLPTIELEIEPTTFRGYLHHVDRHIAPGIGDVRIGQINRDLLKAFYADLLRTPSARGKGTLAKTTVERIHATIHRALEALVQADVLDRNPAHGARPKRKKSERYEAKIWSPQQLADFLDFVRSDELFPMWRVMAWTGIRRGEALGLMWDDFHPTSRILSVRRAVCNAAGRIYFSTPKSAQSRVIDLDPVTTSVLSSHRRRMNSQRRRSGARLLESDDLIFPSADGTVYAPEVISHRFRVLADASEVPRIRLHDLRHTHASHLLEAGVHPKIVQERMGHVDVMVTLNIYAHLTPTLQRQAVGELGRFYCEGS